MLSRIELEELSFADLKDLAKKSGLTLPQHANADTLVQMMEEFYAKRQQELAGKVQADEDAALFGTQISNSDPIPTPDTPEISDEEETAAKGKYAGYNTKREYINAMLKPVLCIITPQSPEFSRQASSMASISVGNALIANREFAFIADGNTVTSVPRIALERIRELKVLLKGSPNMDKMKMTSNTQGSAFGLRFRIHELSDVEIQSYQASKKDGGAPEAATGIGL